MIVSRFEGGLGNQLFQYAIGRFLAHKHNTELKFDLSCCPFKNNSHHAFYKLNNFNVIENFATTNYAEYLKVISEKQVSDISVILNAPDNTFLHGYWQNEKYFIEIRDILLREFTLKNPLRPNSVAWKEKILSATCAVSLHVRHGDYLTYGGRNGFGIISEDYYLNCIAELHKHYSDITVFVFSDDLQWCKDNLNFGMPTEFVEGCEYDFEEMYLMSLCKHNVISNSTFSWWGAWLNQNPDKKVFAPDPWGNPPIVRNPVTDSWIKFPADYSLNRSPMMSIIVYVEDNVSVAKFSFMSIFGQNFSDYEIILIDTSKNGSSEVCRQFAQNKNVTILTVNRHTKKFSAWNKALNIARGDYVLFLTTKDFLFPHTTENFSKIGDSYLLHTTYSARTKNLPNVICTTQYLEENERGTYVLNGLEDKNFLIKIDTLFEKLNFTIDLQMPDSHKLINLATKSINNLIGTKFFKRQFISDKNITFSDRGGWMQNCFFLSRHFCRQKKLRLFHKFFLGGLNKYIVNIFSK